MVPKPIPIVEMQAWGSGLHRPEDVAVDRDGRVFASDANAAISEIRDDGTLRPIGKAGGEPNGINLTADGREMLIANFAGHAVQALDLQTGDVRIVCDTVGDRQPRFANYPIVASDGTIYCSSSTQELDFVSAIVEGRADGHIFRIAADGTADVVADGIVFANGLALDADERYLYCARTSAGDVVRFPVLHDGTLGEQQPYGPPMGDRSEYGEDGIRAVWGDNPERTYASADMSVLYRWGMTDGCAFDVEGNLWVTVASQGRIVVITPEQDLVTIVDDPEWKLVISPTNVSFGGPDLRDVYFGSIATPFVVKGRSSVPGLPLVGQR